jgi:L-fuculose-phosphate aldolase
MTFHHLPPHDQLVAIMNRIYQNGMTTLSGGNLSLLDAAGDLWITPAGVDKGRLRGADMMRVGADGAISGPHRPSSELPFHRAIYQGRPDVRAIVHAHSPALVSFSLARQTPDTRLLPSAGVICGRVGYAPYALTGSEALGEAIAAAFAAGNDCVMLENHGVVTAGRDLLEAFQRLETLELCAQTIIRARTAGDLHSLTVAELNRALEPSAPLPEFHPDPPDDREQALRQQIVEMTGRAYDRRLMGSRQGTVSLRLDAQSFLITPDDQDRHLLLADEVALVSAGRCAAGRQPGRLARLHQAIYAAQPDVQCVMTAQSPYATAYALAEARFDSRTIPESYIMLRAAPLVPFAGRPGAEAEVAALVSLQRPLLLLAHEGVLAVGSSALNAFDRLEVMEFSARSLLETAVIGPLIPIGDAEIRELERVFHLT